MNDNLIFYINKLSFLIVGDEFEAQKKLDKQGDRYFLNCVKRVKQKGCDVLLNRSNGTPIEDPCVTDYGGNWSPLTLITDYGRELQSQGAVKQNDLLMSCLETLQEKPYDCVDNLLKLLLLLKKPLEPSVIVQNDLSLKNSDFLLDNMDSLSFLSEDFSNQSLNKNSSYKKSIHYEESWTKNFDSKFQLLGEFSRKNLLTPEKVSVKSILSTKPLISSPSRTNCFGFTDFFYERNYKSEKSLFDINSNSYVNESPLLDKFVDRPISHKLPTMKLNMKFSCKSGFLESSSDHIHPASSMDEPSRESSYDDTISRKSSVIELKRNSNCSHCFSILYEKSVKSQYWTLSNDSLAIPRKEKSVTPRSTSKEIILGLWEQEQSIIKEFRPELASTFPDLRMITLGEFVEDVKYLFTGINSDTFKYDTEKLGFNMVYGTCLDDVTPESLFHFSTEFIEIGDCYVKLISCVYETGKNNFDTCTTISQAFWKSIFDFLELHYSLVLEIPTSINLMALKSCTRDLHEIITTIAGICKVNTKEALPQGGELLTYLLKFAERISRQCVTNIVFGILQNCCSVYYLCILQNWMFKGRLDNQSNEFFVSYRGRRGKPKSRSYGSSFLLLDEKIPSFLRGFEESFFNCGKSIHFLKLFNPEDSFCQILEKGDYPSMKICFSDDQVEKLEADFKSYEEAVLKQCGERITIKSLKEEEAEKERNYQEYIAEVKRIQERERNEARLQQQKKMAEKRNEQNKLLNETLSLIEGEKERKKEEERLEELRLEEEIKKLKEARQNMLNEEKNILINTYADIMNNLEQEIVVAEIKSESLKKLLNNTSEHTIENVCLSDAINCNDLETDQEGNIRSDLDENSNKSLDQEGSAMSSYDENSNKSLDQICSAQGGCDENSNKSLDRVGSAQGGYDENSNPKTEMQKSISYRTVAAEEAKRNRNKILNSEFGVPARSEPNTSDRIERKETLTDLQRNRQRVLMSEYNILLKNLNTEMSITSVPHKLEIVKDTSEQESESIGIDDDPTIKAFETVQLERKQECMNLKERGEKPIAPSQSSESYLASSNDLSGENASNASEEIDNRPSAMVLREKYMDALARDVEIFSKKSSHQDIFCSLKEEEIDNLPCTDYLKFQRYLRKSALIPLRVQEKLANDALLKHILKGENLLAHLNSLRGYFFLNDGEFGRSFTHLMFRSLSKCTEPNQFFERGNLSNIVNEALNYTIHNSSPNSQLLSFRIVNMPPFLNHSSHDVLSPFELSYKVEWPLNFILTEKALSKYRMVFRFLLKLKRIKWTMNENFLYLNSLFKNKRLNRRMLVGSPHYHKIQIFRHAITQVIITLDDYIFSNGVQCSWLYFLKDLETTENIDHLYQKHVRYIKDVLKRCFLSRNSEDLVNGIHNLIELALKFHYTVKTSSVELTGGRYEHPKFQVLKTTFNEFCSVLKNFLKSLKEKIGSNEVLRSHYVLIEKFDLKLT